MTPTVEAVLAAISTLRAPIQRREYNLHALVLAALGEAGLPCQHEAVLGPRCRIDILCGGIGVEIKRGKPEKAKLSQQLARYAACPQVEALVVVSERTAALPRTIGGKPVHTICLNKLWGIAI